MLRVNYSYKDISEEIQCLPRENLCLDKQAVLDRMIEDLPQNPWANINILDWQTIDDNLPIMYYFYNSPFGKVLAANTSKGVCYLGLIENKREDVLSDFQKRFHHTNRIETKTSSQKQVIDFLDGERNGLLQFHLKGTFYQTEIWRKLIRIPYGKVISYATLGGNHQSARAAGTANGRNPIFWIIPCQRVVKTTGEFDRYFWGKRVKKQLLAWEFANSPN